MDAAGFVYSRILRVDGTAAGLGIES